MSKKREGHPTKTSEHALAVILRLSGLLLLLAIIPAVMPFAWMQTIHRQLGLGQLPEGPILDYLTRSLSAMYALHGVILFFVASDVRRFLPVVKCLAVLGIVFGIGMIVLDVSAGMPLSWTIGEGPFIIALGAVLLWLTRRASHGIPSEG